MSQKDVEIKFRATDNASKSVKKISDALKVIDSDFKKTSDSAKLGDGALGGLATSMAKLNNESAKLKSFGVITDELNRNTQALKAAKQTAKEAAGDYGRLASTQAKNAVTQGRYRQSLEAEKAAQLTARDGLKRINAERVEANKLVRQAEKALKSYNAELTVRRVGRSNQTFQNVPNAAQAATGSDLSSNVAASRKAVQDNINDAARYRAEIIRTDAALADLKPQVTAVDKRQKELTKSLKESVKALSQQRSKVAETTSELAEITAVSNSAKASLGSLAVSQDKVADASARMALKVAAAQAQLSTLNSANAPTTIKRDFNDPSNQLSVTRATFETAKAYREAQEEVRRLAADMRNTKAPTDEMAAAFGRSQAQAKLAAQAYREQQRELRKTASTAQSSFRAFSQSVDGKSPDATRNVVNVQDSINAQQRLAPLMDRTANATTRAASATNTFGGSLLNANRDTRQSLGLMQRLRGEVLAVTASYIGFQAAIQGIQQSLTAFQALEAVESRLGAVFNQDTARVSAEVSFLRSEADRLGISFSVLAGQYSKFAIAGKAANFSGESTRKMFIAVAEAGRVNRLSMEQLNGTFLAIEQIISKGKFTSEEVRRQLGDRLPGAFNILANAMGLTTAELDKMMSSGKLLATESNLLKFTGEMTRQFGPQLSASLDSLSVDLGRFENDVFKSQLALADGFIPALRTALQAFGDFANSKEGNDAFLQIGDAIGVLIGAVLEVPKYIDFITFAIKTLVGISVGAWASRFIIGLSGLTGGFTSLGAQIAFIGPQMGRMTIAQRILTQGFAQIIGATDRWIVSLNGAAAAGGRVSFANRIMAGTLLTLRGGMILTGNVARAMWAAIGGLPGLIVTGIIFAISAWAGGVDDATSALSEHQRQLNLIREAYAASGEGVAGWASEIKGLNKTIAQAALVNLEAAYSDALTDFLGDFREIAALAETVSKARAPDTLGLTSSARNLSEDYMSGIESIDLLLTQLKSGEIGIDDFIDALDKINTTNADQEIKRLATELSVATIAAADGETSLRQLGTAVVDQKKAIDILGGGQNDLVQSTKQLEQSTYDADEAFRSENLAIYTDSINTLKSAIPELAAEMEKLKSVTELNEAAWNGLTAAWATGDYSKIFEIAALWGQGVTQEFNAADATTFGGAGQATAAGLIKQREGFIDRAEWDVNAFRVGFGSDTTTDMSGNKTAVTANTVTTRADADRDLARRITEFQSVIKREIGAARFDSFSTDQQAVLTSLAYNYGSLAGTRQTETFRTGTTDEIVAALRGLATDNNGINSGRRNQEADIFAAGGTTSAISELDAVEAARIAEIAADNSEKQNAATTRRIADNDFELRQQILINSEREKAAAIQLAIREARAENPDITPDELGMITNQAATLFDTAAAAEAAEIAAEMATDRADQRAATAERIGDTEFEIGQQRLINSEMGKQAAIESAIRDAKRENPNITAAEIASITRLTALLYEQNNVVNERELSEERINLLMSTRSSLLDQLELAQESGDVEGASGIKTQLESINAELQEVIANTIAMYQTLGGAEADAAIAKLTAQSMEISRSSDGIVLLGLNASQFQSLVGSFADGLVNGIDSFVKRMADGETAIKAGGQAFLQFASDFLRQIGMMILKQVLLNTLSAFGGPIGIAAAGLGGITGHTGGIVGSQSIGSGNRIGTSPWASSAFTYHSGGIAGLRPDEVSATLRRNEEVLTEQDPRHRYNLGGESNSTGGRQGIKQVLAIGDNEIANAMSGAAGEDVVMTIIRRNRTTIRGELG
jgi:tape measure domain-containing protein